MASRVEKLTPCMVKVRSGGRRWRRAYFDPEAEPLTMTRARARRRAAALGVRPGLIPIGDYADVEVEDYGRRSVHIETELKDVGKHHGWDEVDS